MGVLASRSPGSSTSAARSTPSRPTGVRGAVLVLVLAALRGRQPAAHAHVLLAAAAVDPDRARGGAGGQRGVSAALYKPFGIAGLVLGTVGRRRGDGGRPGLPLRRELHGFEVGGRSSASSLMLLLGGCSARSPTGLVRLDDAARPLADRRRPSRSGRPSPSRVAVYAARGLGCGSRRPGRSRGCSAAPAGATVRA